ncbi:MAG: hypothetical protein M0017_11030 [Desulfobacteraceae bacterium]|nr:hypothetical protein [Desulfobacteraceae bacterium]
MEVEIWLDLSEANPEDHEVIHKRFLSWYAEGAEVRYGKSPYGQLTDLGDPSRFRVDLGQADPLTAIRDLHARLHRHGVKVFVHFYY